MSKIITVAQQKGGTGKTTITAQLAVAFTNIYKKVLAVDIDPQGSLSTWYDLRQEYYNSQDIKIDCTKLLGWKASNELERLKQSYDLTIVDCPPHTDSDTKTVIRSADLVIIPLQASPTDLWATKTTIELAEAEDKKIILLLNRIIAHNKISEVITKQLPKLPQITLGQRVAYATSMIDGRSVIESDASSMAAKELKEAVKGINKYLKKI